MAKKKSGKTAPAVYPAEWAWGKGMLVKACDNGNRRTVERQLYDLSGDDGNLTLRVTLNIWGGSALFMRFDTKEAEQAYLEEDGRRQTWLKALAMAELLCKSTSYCAEFVVLYCPPGTLGESKEVIFISQRFNGLPGG